MRFLFSILLIPMVLASQSLCAVHMHIGTHSAELGSHPGTPHFHAEAGHGHGGLHSNGRETLDVPQSGVEDFPDHNETAYYVSDSVSRDTNRLAHDKLAELLLVNIVGHELSTLSLNSFSIANADGLRYCCLSGNARIPLFLRDASIRC